jgi:hypothetical protein
MLERLEGNNYNLPAFKVCTDTAHKMESNPILNSPSIEPIFNPQSNS